MSDSEIILTETIDRKIYKIKSLTDEEHSKLENARMQIQIFRYFERRRKEVELNYNDLILTIENYEIDASARELSADDLDIIFLNVNRLFVNFITSLKFYIEYLDSHYKKFGQDSVEYKTFKECKEYCNENYFSYKLFYQLRNYAQHIDFPITSFNQERDYSTEERKLNIQFNKDELVKYQPIKSKCKIQLASYNNKFPLKPLLIEILIPIKRLDAVNYKIYENVIKEMSSTIQRYIQYLSTPTSELEYGKVSLDKKMGKLTNRVIEFKLASEIEGNLKDYKARKFT